MAYNLAIKHNIEVAHRLSLLPGKCEAIHGHSMWVTLEVHSPNDELDQHSLMDGLDFGNMKKAFRAYLDSEFDHKLLLNPLDIWAQPIFMISELQRNEAAQLLYVTDEKARPTVLPGLRTMIDGDPSTENIAREIGEWSREHFGKDFFYVVDVWETSVNKAGWTG